MNLLACLDLADIHMCRFITNHIWKTSNHPYVAMFHDISGSADRYACTAGVFERYIAELRDRDRIGRDLRDLAESDNRVLITFDDGFRSIKDIVLPIMKRYDCPFTIFVATDYIGRENYLTWAELKSVAKEPLCTIGSHSISHPRFRELDRKEALIELKESKLTLERELGGSIDSFAFPYGSLYAVDRQSKKDAMQIYQHVYSTHPLVLRGNFAKRSIPRLNMPYILKEGR